MATKTTVSAERLRELVHYDRGTGIFTRLVRTCGKTHVGKVCGSTNTRGYLQTSIDNRAYLVSRLAFLYVTGDWPCGVVDHINGNKQDNRWANLRDVTPTMNTQNRRKATKRNKTGLLGVSPCGNKFAATIGIDKTKRHLGLFDDPHQANEAYLRAKRVLHAGNTL